LRMTIAHMGFSDIIAFGGYFADWLATQAL